MNSAYVPQRQFSVKRKAGKHNTSIGSEEKSWQNKVVESEREASIRSDKSYYFDNKVLKEFKEANSSYKLCWQKNTFFPASCNIRSTTILRGNDPFSEILFWRSRVSTAIQTQTKILDYAYSCLQ